jgi:hypothetical protein
VSRCVVDPRGVLANSIDRACRVQSADPKALPPLAVLHQNKVPCSGLSDVYWVSSFAKKNLFDDPDSPER